MAWLTAQLDLMSLEQMKSVQLHPRHLQQRAQKCALLAQISIKLQEWAIFLAWIKLSQPFECLGF